MLVFGPVPSRRLGHSLGINNIPPKTCSYACVYCQVGRTTRMDKTRRPFYAPGEILEAVTRKLEDSHSSGVHVDYVTFVPDGEPTLDLNLEQEIEGIKALGQKVAVIGNASLVWSADVRSALSKADWVSLKIDAALEDPWHRVNRPHGRLRLGEILDGARAFAQSYRGELVTETMLVRDVNDDQESVAAVANYLAGLGPRTAFISAPTRPPAEPWVSAPREDALQRAFQIFSTHVDRVEFLISYEGDDFVATSNVEEDLLNITAVHPMREDAVKAFLERAGAHHSVAGRLVADGALARVFYEGHWFYLRRFPPTEAGRGTGEEHC